ncbi:MAG: carbonate dehydratase, partial [Proteobacteria bacterium]
MTDRSSADRKETRRPTPWHTLSPRDTEERLQTGVGGLSQAEARWRLEQHGPNRLAPPKRRGPMRRLLMQFHNVLLYVMLGAALVTALLEHWIDTGVLLMAVVINAIIGFIQEGKAESALDTIRAMLSTRAVVVRDGQHREIDAAELVPG